MRSAGLCAASMLGLLLVTSGAVADPIPSLDLRGFTPPTAPDGSLYLEPTATPGPFAWNLGVFTSYAYRLVSLENGDDRVAIPVEHQLSLDYVGSVGIGDRVAIGAALPAVPYQSGDDVTGLIGGSQLPRTAIGDAAFTAKATLLPTAELGGFGVAALGRVTAPTGDGASYVSDGTVKGELRLLGELKLIAINLQATAGARVRGSERSYAGEDFGHDLPWGVAINLRPQAFGLDKTGRWLWTAEVRGAVAITPSFASGPQSPLRGGLNARYTVGDISAIGGFELPLNDAVGNPTVRAVIGLGFAPRFYDEDKDGVADDKDECPELEEDKDGFEDHDGCPDFDNDDDGVPDPDDRCPKEAEDEDEYQDDDGCVDPDNDGDAILDVNDACPDQAGADSSNPETRGCPANDPDGDSVFGAADKCPDDPEDKDGHQDEDGCPDSDNDGDGVVDEEDACPAVAGAARSDPKLNGCLSPDQDGDTFDDKDDKCPDKAEDFDGVEDDDGCPDDDSNKPAYQQAKPLVTTVAKGDTVELSWRVPPSFVATAGSIELAPKAVPTARAVAQLLNKNPSWVLLVGVRPVNRTPESEQEALSKSFAFVNRLRSYTHRDEVAESVSWSAVEKQPGAYASGVGVVVLSQPAKTLSKAVPMVRKPGFKLPSAIKPPSAAAAAQPASPAKPAPAPAKPPTPPAASSAAPETTP